MSSEPPEPMRSMRRFVYSREFMLSVGESEHCKKLPPGFDVSLLSELQEVSAGVLDRNKGHYTTPLGRSDVSLGYTYVPRGGNSGGRWDTRSSGSSDREGDLPDRDPLMQDRRNGNQYKRNWQNNEHDGLLGSGVLPKPPGYSGQLAPKDRGNVYQPTKTSERYQPPRPKGAPLSRKDIDAINDETFGSFECSNEDRAEEEKKRRALFELMRKEQHKVLQEKKNGPAVEKENSGHDTNSLLQTHAENTGATATNDKPPASAVSSFYQEDTSKTSSILPSSSARPLVPPGFSNAFVEKKYQPQPSNISDEPKVHNATSEDIIPAIAQFGGRLEGNQSATEITASKNKDKGMSDNIASVDKKYILPSGGITSSTEFSSSIMKGSEAWEINGMDKYSIEKEGKSENTDLARKDNSISILEQFFGNALSQSSTNLPPYVETQQLKTDDDMIVSSGPESSKFARWFKEDLKPAEDLPSKSLLSMIVKNEDHSPENKAPGPPLSDGAVQNFLPRSPTHKHDAASKFLSFTSASSVGILEHYNHADVPEPAPVMMTCEDLEQTMLAQVASSSSSTKKTVVQDHRVVSDEPSATQKVAVDNRASHHLLSLLQKGTDNKGSSSLGFHVGSADESQSPDVNAIVNDEMSGSAPINRAETVPSAGKSLTLETLFGAAFMNELQSKDAPVSIRGSAAGGPNYEYAETGKSSVSSSHEGYYPGEHAVPFGNIRDVAGPKEPGSGMEYRNSAFPGPSQGSASFDNKGLEIQLPEEDNLFTMNDTLDVHKPNILPSVRSSRVEGLLPRSSRVEGLLPEKAVDNLNYRLQSLVPGDAEHVQVLGPDSLGSLSREQRYQVESQNLYHLLQGRPPVLAPRPAMDHIGNRNQQAPFDMPQAMQHDPRRSMQNNMNPMQHTVNAPGAPHIDPAAHHLMLQHMSMPGNFPPEGLPRGVLPSQPVHHLPGYRPEMSNVNNLHMHPRQPNYGEYGMMMAGPSGPEVRSHHPEAFERLIQMELSARSKQIRPAMAGPVPGGMYGPELNMNLRYR